MSITSPDCDGSAAIHARPDPARAGLRGRPQGRTIRRRRPAWTLAGGQFPALILCRAALAAATPSVVRWFLSPAGARTARSRLLRATFRVPARSSPRATSLSHPTGESYVAPFTRVLFAAALKN